MLSKPRMRDAFIEGASTYMRHNKNSYFISADLGAPALDALRHDFPSRFINCGIAEANLINIATGLALEGFTVYAYAIAPFLTMRCYEQIRVNLALLSQIKPINVSLVGVGAGCSYDLSGPSHQALEDIAIMRVLPNLRVLSPADSRGARQMAEQAPSLPGPKYVRLDGKLTDLVYPGALNLERGFEVLRSGERLCLVATGYMTHSALKVASKLEAEGIAIGVVDMHNLSSPDLGALAQHFSAFPRVASLEEGFIGRGGLDALILNLLNDRGSPTKFTALGMKSHYLFQSGQRKTLLGHYGIDEDSIYQRIKQLLAPSSTSL